MTSSSERSLGEASLSRRSFLAGTVGAVLLGGALSACGAGGTTSADAAAAGPPKRGGNFRLGVTGGGSKDTFDAQVTITKPDEARLVSSFETLLTFDNDYKLVEDGLALHVSRDNPSEYTIELRQGVEFQNGKTMTADDVIYSFQRIATGSNGRAMLETCG